jgi:hypothetical protein
MKPIHINILPGLVGLLMLISGRTSAVEIAPTNHALCKAVTSLNAAAVEKILAKIDNVNMVCPDPDNRGQTLHISFLAMNSPLDVKYVTASYNTLKLLLDNGLDANAYDGNSHILTRCSPSTCALLLSAGADPNLPTGTAGLTVAQHVLSVANRNVDLSLLSGVPTATWVTNAHNILFHFERALLLTLAAQKKFHNNRNAGPWIAYASEGCSAMSPNVTYKRLIDMGKKWKIPEFYNVTFSSEHGVFLLLEDDKTPYFFFKNMATCKYFEQNMAPRIYH